MIPTMSADWLSDWGSNGSACGVTEFATSACLLETICVFCGNFNWATPVDRIAETAYDTGVAPSKDARARNNARESELTYVWSPTGIRAGRAASNDPAVLRPLRCPRRRTGGPVRRVRRSGHEPGRLSAVD